MATTREQLDRITAAILKHGGDIQTIMAISDASSASPAWTTAFSKILDVILSGKVGNSIFTKGNSKLPFLSFSSLPGAGYCPGAGDCLKFCYSFKAWRYPQAFSRQVQNHLLLQSPAGRELILADLDKKTYKNGKPIPTTVRLYVDGDFYNDDIFTFWMNAIAARPHLTVYGYSKSFDIINRNSSIVPANYVLNLSSGHNASPDLVSSMERKPFVRGHFIATDSGKKDQYLADTGRRAFECPGKCGDCLPSGIHACGQLAIRKDIIIATH